MEFLPEEMHGNAPSKAAASKAARLESGRDCTRQMGLIHYNCLHSLRRICTNTKCTNMTKYSTNINYVFSTV